MLNIETIKRGCFIDIETAHGLSEFSELSPIMKKHWGLRSVTHEKWEVDLDKTYKKYGALYPEFGRIVCISIANLVTNEETILGINTRSFAALNEAMLLRTFAEHRTGLQLYIGHNIKSFDLPYICKRLLINGIDIPARLDNGSKKPWEILDLDTLEYWKFGSFNGSVKLELLCEVLGIESPKNNICGADVSKLFWETNDLDSIVDYCEGDVFATIQVCLRLANQRLINNVTT